MVSWTGPSTSPSSSRKNTCRIRMRIQKGFWSVLQTIGSILLKTKHWLVSVPKSSNWTEKKKLQNSHGVFPSVIGGQSCYRFWLQKVIISIELQEVQQSWTKAELNSVPSFQQCISHTSWDSMFKERRQEEIELSLVHRPISANQVFKNLVIQKFYPDHSI